MGNPTSKSRPTGIDPRFRGGIFDTPGASLSSLLPARGGSRPHLPDTSTVSSTQGMAELRRRREARAARRRRERARERARAQARRRGEKHGAAPKPSLELGPEFDAPPSLEELLADTLAGRTKPAGAAGKKPLEPEESPYLFDPFPEEDQRGVGSFVTGMELEAFDRLLSPYESGVEMEARLREQRGDPPYVHLSREDHLREAQRIAELSRRPDPENEPKTFGEQVKAGWEWFDGGKDRAALPFQVFGTPLIKLQGKLSGISKLNPKDLTLRGKSRSKLYQEAYADYVRDTGGNTEYGATARAYMESLLTTASSAAGGRVAAGLIAAAPIPTQAKLPINVIVSGAASMGAGALASQGQEESWKRIDPSGGLYRAMQEQRASDAENFPVGTTVGQTGSAAVFGRFGRAALPTRLAAGALSAGTGMAVDAFQGNPIDPLRGVLDFGTGALLNKDSRYLGRPIGVVSAKVGRGIARPLGLAPGGRNTYRGRAQAAAVRDARNRAWLAEQENLPQNRVTASHLRPTYEPREVPGRAPARLAEIAELPDGQRLLMPEQGPRSTRPKPVPTPEQQTNSFLRGVRAVARQGWGESEERPTGHAALENVLDVFDKAGAFSSRREKDAARSLWQARAGQWARETGRDQNEFYDGLQANLDGETPKDALHQEATQSALQEFVEKSLGEKNPDKLYLTASYADAAKIGLVKLRSGAEFYMFGGPFTHVKNIDFHQEDGFGWRVSSKSVGNRIVKQAIGKLILDGKLNSAVLHVAIKNSLENVFASHGNIAIKAEIMNAIKKGYDKKKLLDYINKTIELYNNEKDKDDDRKVQARVPKVESIEGFIGTKSEAGVLDQYFDDDIGLYDPSNSKWKMGVLDTKVKSFPKRQRFAKLFWNEKENPFDANWMQVATLMTQPEVAHMETGAAMAIIGIDKNGEIKLTRHPLYPIQVPGANLGILQGKPIGVSFPEYVIEGNKQRLVDAGLAQLDKKMLPLLEKKAQEDLIRIEEAQRGVPVDKLTSLLTKADRKLVEGFERKFEPSYEALRQANNYTATRFGKMNVSGKFTDAAGNERVFANEGIFPLDPHRLSTDHLFQEGEAGVKAWYDLQTRTMGAMTKKSDLSSFVHESWHDWTTSLKEDHTSLLEKHFGSRDSVEFQERGARAFERYLHDGYAPHPELRQLFETIKQAMVNIYHQVKGTPIEDSVHPDIRKLFDDVLGAGQAQSTHSASGRKPQNSALSRLAQPMARPPLQAQRPAVRMRPPAVAPGRSSERDEEKRPPTDVGAQLRQALALAQSNPALAQRLKQQPIRPQRRAKRRRNR